jgi:DNA-binding GntR family transcriptional regulator
MDLRVARKTVQSEAADKLRQAIVTGFFKPGQKLVEASLCEMLGVSRTSVREALRELASEKLVDTIPNRGPFVASITREEAEHIYHVRALLEGEASALLAKRVSDDEITRMERALVAFERSVRSGDALGRLSHTNEFYAVIISGCGNPVLGDLASGLLARINFLRARTMERPGRAKHSAAEMRRLFEAVSRRDPRGARAAAVEHVRSACDEARDVYAALQAA